MRSGRETTMSYDLTARRTDEPPRRFKLVRDEDETGISGLGVVAFGVVFSDGVTVTRWNSDVAQTCVWQSFDEVDAVHGHGGRTRIEWVDESDDVLYRMVCDSVTHEEEGTQLEDGEVKDDAAEPIDGRCLDWHPQLVRYVEVGKGDN